MIGAIDHQAGLRHISIFEGSNPAETFTEFLENLNSKIEGRQATLVLDNLSVHRSKLVLSKSGLRDISTSKPYSCRCIDVP